MHLIDNCEHVVIYIGGERSMARLTKFLLLIIIFSLSACSNIQSNKGYTYEELVLLPSEELLDLFVDNGLIINKGLEHLNRLEIGTLLKDQFDFMILGVTSLDSVEYSEMALNVKNIYREIVEGTMYTYDQLKLLEKEELLQLFETYGLEIPEDISHLEREQISEVLSSQFDLMIQGTTSLSSVGYAQMAEDVQRIYLEITK